MAEKPTYEQLKQRIRELEHSNPKDDIQWTGNKPGSLNHHEIDIRNLDLGSIINETEIRPIMEDLYSLNHITTAFLDIKGKVIEATGWQDICTKFHRVNPRTACNCTESDLFLAQRLKPGEFVDYKCKNGLWDIVTPLYIGTSYLGNIYTGQFFYEDEPIDESAFIRQAEIYGFDKGSYIDALRRVPRCSREHVTSLMKFLVKFTTYISKISLANIQLGKEIVERKKVQDALRKSEAEFRSLFDAGPVAVGMLVNRTLNKVNAVMSQITGYSEEELIGKSTRTLFADDEEFIRVGNELYGAMERYGQGVLETSLRRKDGTMFDVLVCACPMDHETRDLSKGVAATLLDVSGHKQAEEALINSESAFRSLFESSPAGIAMLKDRIILRMNAMLCSITGYSESELIGQPSRILYNSEEDFIHVGQALYNNEQKECLSGVESRIKRKDGSTIDVLIITKQIDPDDSSKGVVATVLDVSDRKRAEAEKARLEEQLRHIHKIESVGRLAGGVAHDFNNMLGVIIGHTEIAMDRINQAEPAYENLEQIRRAAQRSADLTRQLLTFARKQTVNPRVLDLNHAVSSMLDMLRRLVGEDIDLEWSPGHEIHAVKIDPTQVDQILVNLVINTRDAIGGPGKVIIETGNTVFNEEDYSRYADLIPGTYTMLAVSDDGCGMEKEQLEHIFEPFFTTKELGKGTGLGLATVYGIVKQNNGFIHVYSEPGMGTTFRIYLPSLPSVSEKKPIIEEKTQSGGTETILVVEDEDAIRNLIIAILKRFGYNVVSARTPGEALQLTESYDGEIHMLLTDVVMPEMNGSQLNDRVKALRPDMKTLFMSGYTSNIIAHHGVLDDRFQFIHKPFSVQKLGSKVREVLDS